MKIQPFDSTNFGSYLENYSNGPVQERKCTDILCLILFIANLVLIILISVYAFSYGNPIVLFRATDSDGNICGIGNTSAYPYAYLTDPLPQISSYTADSIIKKRICIDSCPLTTTPNQTLNCYPNSMVKNCTPTFIVTSNSDQIPRISIQYENGTVTISDLNQSVILYPTVVELGYFCMLNKNYQLPFSNQKSLQKQIFNSAYKSNFLLEWIKDIYQSYYLIASTIVLSLILSLVYYIFLKYFEISTILFTMIMQFLGISAIGYFVWQCAIDAQNKTLPNAFYYKVLAVIIWGFVLLYLVYTICLYKKIRFGIKLIEVVLTYTWKECRILIFSVFMLFLELIILSWIIITCFYLLGSTKLSKSKTHIFTEIDDYTTIQMQMLFYFIAGGIWLLLFIQALNEYVISSFTCIYYFGNGPFTNQSHKPLAKSIYRSLRYNIGSVALGALFVWFGHMFVLFIQFFQLQKLKMGNICFSIFNCICCPLRLFFQHFNKKGYIMMALSGDDFMKSSMVGISNIWDYRKKVVSLSHIGETLVFFANLFIVSYVVIIFYIILTYTNIPIHVNDKIGPCMTVIFFSLIISLIILDVLSSSCSAFITCFLLEYEHSIIKQKGKRYPIVLVQLYENFIMNE